MVGDVVAEEDKAADVAGERMKPTKTMRRRPSVLNSVNWTLVRTRSRQTSL